MKKLIQLLTILIISVANGQSYDVLIWNADTLNLYSNPLKSRTDWEQISTIISSKLLEERLSENKDSIIAISPWQDYQTEWILKNDSIYLKNITSTYKTNRKLDFQNIFQTKKNLIFANWVDKNLIIYSGNCIICTGNHFHNSSIYENEKVLQFEKGLLSKVTDYENVVLRKSAASFLNPNDYLDFIYKKIDWKTLPELNDKQYQVSVSIEPYRNGKFKKIDWKNTFVVFDGTFLQDKENLFIKESVRIAKQMTDWGVVIRQDNILNQQITILFDEKMKNKYDR